MPDVLRRMLTVALALTLVMGLMPHGMRAADAGVKMAMSAAGNMTMPGQCDACGDGQKAMTSSACSAYCSGVVALPSIETVLEPASAEAFEGIVGPQPAGFTVPPDPYPPRPVLS